MPRLWTETIDEHRRAVREATLDAAARIVAEQGLLSVTMSRIAEEAGIGRATLYKYFPDVESILLAWHERQVGAHLEQLLEVRNRVADPLGQLEAVLDTYALIAHEHHGSELAALLHRGEHVGRAHQHLRGVIAELIGQGATSGALRDDVAPTELASYCLHALEAAGELSSRAAVRRLVKVVRSGLASSAP